MLVFKIFVVLNFALLSSKGYLKQNADHTSSKT